uniref:Neuronal acetylcholine receptor subunit alpha-4-like n=1 Tax=Drosophila rhopaloa TaxID=1041015 RepID=A0A6P4FMA8_DRORH
SVAISYCLLCLAPIDYAESALQQTRFNVSFSQLEFCETYMANPGYLYRDFFEVHELSNNNKKAGERLHLKFYVMTSMDAHILLSVTNHMRFNDRVYEIVIGAGGNKFSAIRTAMGMRRVATNSDSNLVSLYEPTPIEIVQTQNKEIAKVVPKPTPTQKLLNQLNFQAENASLPANLNSLRFHFKTKSIAYEQPNSLLRTRMHMMLHWQDPRLSWKPAEFDNQESFEHKDLRIWTPNMNVLNGALDSMGPVLRSFELRVFASGKITLSAQDLQLTSWCVDSARNWPNERVTCDIELGLIGQEEQGNMALIYDQQNKPIPTNDHVNTLSGWTFKEVSVVPVGNDSSRRYTPKGMLQTVAGDVAIEFTLQRNRNFYMTVFYLPLIACQMFLVMSFVLRSTRRSALILITLLITAWGLMYMTRYASPHYVPPLMSAYKSVMMATTYCYILHICIIWLELYPPRTKAPDCLVAVLNSTLIRCFLGLRPADSSDYCQIQGRPWPHLAKILNNFSSIVIIVIFAIINITTGI